MGYAVAFAGIFAVVFGLVAASAVLGSESVRPRARRRRFVQRAAVGALVVAVLGTFGLYTVTHHPSAAFRVTVRTFRVLPDQYVRVFLTIANVGTLTAAPDCAVTVQPTDAYGDDLRGSGVDAATWPAMRPGATVHTYLDVLVSDDEAHAVTSARMITARCS